MMRDSVWEECLFATPPDREWIRQKRAMETIANDWYDAIDANPTMSIESSEGILRALVNEQKQKETHEHPPTPQDI